MNDCTTVSRLQNTESFDTRVYTTTAQQFRQAAATGNTDLMLSLFHSATPQLSVCTPDPQSQQTAAHLAAAKGHAAVLRLLHSLGDPFISVDSNSQTPMQLANDAACKEVFELASLAKATLAAAKRVFPDRIGEEDTMQQAAFMLWRSKKERTIQEKVTAATIKLSTALVTDPECTTKKFVNLKKWMDNFSESLKHQFDIYYSLEMALTMNCTSGLCGEVNGVGYGYLANVAKTTYPVELVGVKNGSNNHAFVALNRQQNASVDTLQSWDKAMLIDAFHHRSFFYENRHAIPQTTIKDGSLDLGSVKILCSNQPLPKPTTKWQPTATIKMMQTTVSMINNLFAAKFATLPA